MLGYQSYHRGYLGERSELPQLIVEVFQVHPIEICPHGNADGVPAYKDQRYAY